MHSWKTKLRETILRLQADKGIVPKIAILGIGNELNGDDAAGVLMARELMKHYADQPQRSNLVIYDCGTLPENFSGPLRKFRPDLILMLDAGSFGGKPGDLLLASSEESEGMSFSTHSLPPSVFADFLINELNCVVQLLLVQAENIDFCDPLNSQIEKTIRETVPALAEIIPG